MDVLNVTGYHRRPPHLVAEYKGFFALLAPARLSAVARQAARQVGLGAINFVEVVLLNI